MKQVIASVYTAVKRTMKAFKWVVFWACVVLIYYVHEFGEYLVEDRFAGEKAMGVLVFFGFLAVLVSGFWSAYYLLERLAGYQGGFSQFFSENVPGRNWIQQITESEESIRKKDKR